MNTLRRTPTINATRKLPWILLQNSLNSPLRRSFQTEMSISEFMASMISEKMPVSNAIVPPDTPGITLAAPIA